MKYVWASVLAFPLCAAVLTGCGSSAANLADHREAVGDSGILVFEVDIDTPLALGTNDLTISIRDTTTNEPFVGATIDFTAIMPAMGHEAALGRPIEEISPGVYSAQDVSLMMAGRWEVQVRAVQPDKQDQALFTYDVR